MFSPTSNGRPSRADNSKMTDGKFWAALGLSTSEIPGVAGHSEDSRLFKRVKEDLRDIVEANMNWHKTYTQQTSRVFDNVTADIQEKHPKLSGHPGALDAMVKYTKYYFQRAHCHFIQRTSGGKAAPWTGSTGIKARYAVDHRIQAESGQSGKTLETTAMTPPPPLSQLTLDNDSLSRPSPSCSEETCITSPSPPSSSSANVPGNIVPTVLPLADTELLEFMRSCDPALEELFASGLDLKTLALAFHIAQLFEGRAAPH